MLVKGKGRLEKALGVEITSAGKTWLNRIAKGKETVAPDQQFLEKFEGAEG